MKRKDPLKILTNQTKANVSFLMMSSPNGTISSNVALNRRKTTEVIIYTLQSLLLNILTGLCFGK